jgi:hypothetical protein
MSSRDQCQASLVPLIRIYGLSRGHPNLAFMVTSYGPSPAPSPSPAVPLMFWPVDTRAGPVYPPAPNPARPSQRSNSNRTLLDCSSKRLHFFVTTSPAPKFRAYSISGSGSVVAEPKGGPEGGGGLQTYIYCSQDTLEAPLARYFLVILVGIQRNSVLIELPPVQQVGFFLRQKPVVRSVASLVRGADMYRRPAVT